MRRWYSLAIRRAHLPATGLRAGYGWNYGVKLPDLIVRCIVRVWNTVTCRRHGHEFFMAKEDNTIRCQHCPARRAATSEELIWRDKVQAQIEEHIRKAEG